MSDDQKEQDRVKVVMCIHYTRVKRSICVKGHRVGLKCHEERKYCRDY
jgi:hypothetical protein